MEAPISFGLTVQMLYDRGQTEQSCSANWWGMRNLDLHFTTYEVDAICSPTSGCRNPSNLSSTLGRLCSKPLRGKTR